MKLLIVDDHGIVRQGLRSLFEQREDVEVVGEAQDGQQAVEMALELHPDMIIMDVTMPRLNGIDATKQILDHQPNAKIIILSMHPFKHIVKEVLRAGAKGYVLKLNLIEELMQAIEAAERGEYYLSPRIAGVVVNDFIAENGSSPSESKSELSHRERQVLQMLVEGRSTKQIALELSLSSKTVDSHRHNIMRKLAVDNLADLTKFAIREGFTPLDM